MPIEAMVPDLVWVQGKESSEGLGNARQHSSQRKGPYHVDVVVLVLTVARQHPVMVVAVAAAVDVLDTD